MKIHNLAIRCVALLGLAAPAYAAELHAKLIPLDIEFQAKVIHITDGDTVTVLTDGKEQKKIRVNGIDCPEAGQAFGNKVVVFSFAWPLSAFH